MLTQNNSPTQWLPYHSIINASAGSPLCIKRQEVYKVFINDLPPLWSPPQFPNSNFNKWFTESPSPNKKPNYKELFQT